MFITLFTVNIVSVVHCVVSDQILGINLSAVFSSAVQTNTQTWRFIYSLSRTNTELWGFDDEEQEVLILCKQEETADCLSVNTSRLVPAGRAGCEDSPGSPARSAGRSAPSAAAACCWAAAAPAAPPSAGGAAPSAPASCARQQRKGLTDRGVRSDSDRGLDPSQRLFCFIFFWNFVLIQFWQS